jgi:hypothetical protein
VVGRQLELEPGTKEGERLMQWESVLHGEQWVASPYRARFPEDDASMLPRVSCVAQLLFEEIFDSERLWAGAALQVAAHCDSLQHLHLDLQEPVRPGHLTYLRGRRQGTIGVLSGLPCSTNLANFVPQP